MKEKMDKEDGMNPRKFFLLIAGFILFFSANIPVQAAEGDVLLSASLSMSVSSTSDGIITNTIRVVNYKSYRREMKAIIWTDEGGQDDLMWITLSRQADGSYQGNYNPSDLKHSGSTNVCIFDHSTCIDRLKTTNTPASAEISVSDNANTSFTVVVGNVRAGREAAVVTLALWTEKNGQDDLEWVEAERQEDGSFAATIRYIDHKSESGPFCIHAYVTDITGDQRLAAATSYLGTYIPETDIESISKKSILTVFDRFPEYNYQGMTTDGSYLYLSENAANKTATKILRYNPENGELEYMSFYGTGENGSVKTKQCLHSNLTYANGYLYVSGADSKIRRYQINGLKLTYSNTINLTGAYYSGSGNTFFGKSSKGILTNYQIDVDTGELLEKQELINSQGLAAIPKIGNSMSYSANKDTTNIQGLWVAPMYGSDCDELYIVCINQTNSFKYNYIDYYTFDGTYVKTQRIDMGNGEMEMENFVYLNGVWYTSGYFGNNAFGLRRFS